MSTTGAGLMNSVEAGENLSGTQVCGLTLESDNTVVRLDGVTDVPFGVLQNKPTSGKTAAVMVIGRTKVEFGETVTVGAQIRFGANGKASIFQVDADVTAYCAGICKEGGDAGEIGTAMINCCNTVRGEEGLEIQGGPVRPSPTQPLPRYVAKRFTLRIVGSSSSALAVDGFNTMNITSGLLSSQILHSA